MLLTGVFFAGCTEDISTDNFAIATEETASDYFANNPEKYSSIKAIFDRVRLGTILSLRRTMMPSLLIFRL